jgi:hypothetical protein
VAGRGDSPATGSRLADYTRDLEIDFEPSGPSIDTHMIAKLQGGGETIIQLRFQSKADKRTREVWDAVYWSMGLICDLDEAHRALGDMLPVIHQFHSYLAAKGQAFLEAYSPALEEGRLTAARTLILRQATRRFDELPGAAEMLAGITTREELESLAQCVLTTDSWSSLVGQGGG